MQDGIKDRSGAEDSANVVAAVHGLFLQHTDLIRGFIRGLLADPALADDVLQETFMTVSRKAAEFRPGTSFPKWVCAIARYKVLEARRAARRGAVLLSPEAIEALAAADEALEPDPRIEDPEACVANLAPSMRRVIELRYQRNHSPAEIAEIIGWKVEAVYVALSRARKLLRELMDARKCRQVDQTA